MTVKTIGLAECRRLMDAGVKLEMVDVRTPAEFAKVHAVGARLMPLDELDTAAIAAWRRNADDPIYVICHSGARAAKACQRLEEAGITHVLSVEGGTAAWEQMGLPVERGGGKVISLERQVRIAAGSLVLLGTVLGLTVHPGFFGIAAFVGCGLVFAGLTDYCGMGMLLAKMPWNRGGQPSPATCTAKSLSK